MSFRLFVYYCALVGAWTGVCGWALGKYVAEQLLPGDWLILQDGVRGMFLGLFVTFGLSLVDLSWNIGWRQWLTLAIRLFVAMTIGALGGLAGGALGQWLVRMLGNYVPPVIFLVLGWTLVGLFIGAAISVFEIGKPKFKKCLVGGVLGGLVGGLAASILREGWASLFRVADANTLWSPTAIGFVTVGLFVGLLVGIVQVILKEAWIRVEAGFRPGRELILSKATTVIGRAEGADIALFGDQGVDKTHAQIVQDGLVYRLEDAGSSTGTFVNEKRLNRPVTLRSGDMIRVGKSVLRFSERSAKSAKA